MTWLLSNASCSTRQTTALNPCNKSVGGWTELWPWQSKPKCGQERAGTRCRVNWVPPAGALVSAGCPCERQGNGFANLTTDLSPYPPSPQTRLQRNKTPGSRQASPRRSPPTLNGSHQTLCPELNILTVVWMFMDTYREKSIIQIFKSIFKYEFLDS